MSKLVVVGSSNTDLVVRVPAIPVPGETVLGDEMRIVPGGKGANQAVAAARLGAQVCFVGCIGTDSFGEGAIQNLTREGIDIHYVVRTDRHPSGVALITVSPQGENAIVVAPGANMHLRPEHIERAEPAIARADAVVAQLEVPLETVEAAARLAKRHRVPFILNPAPACPLHPDLLRMIAVLIPNEAEARQLTGAGSEVGEEAMLQVLMEQGCPRVVITLGARGAIYNTESEIHRQPALHVQAVDTTAAGDAFVAGFTVALTEGSSMHEAVRFGQRVAAIAVTRWGAQPSLPTRKEVEQFAP
ncbi:Ribokinase [bacterium HR15]|nr:Ribokinase [bacterium HR15]